MKLFIISLFFLPPGEQRRIARAADRLLDTDPENNLRVHVLMIQPNNALDAVRFTGNI